MNLVLAVVIGAGIGVVIISLFILTGACIALIVGFTVMLGSLLDFKRWKRK